jgi:hypothetical protein
MSAKKNPLGVEVTESADGRHVWVKFADHKMHTVGVHVDAVGSWVELRSQSSKQYPEIAISVSRATGRPVLQVCESDGSDPVSIDLVRAATLLKKLISAAE